MSLVLERGQQQYSDIRRRELAKEDNRMFDDHAQREGQTAESDLCTMSRVRSGLLGFPPVVHQGSEDAGGLFEHLEAAERRTSIHKGRSPDQESSEADTESIADEADTELVQHRDDVPSEADQEEYYNVIESAGFP